MYDVAASEAPLSPEVAFGLTVDPLANLPRQRSIEIFTPDGNYKPYAVLQDEIFAAVLEECEGCMSDVARALKIGRSTLYRHIGPE